MSEASYTAWDDNLYEWPPPDGWYQADDGKWWPQGYGPRGDRSEEPSGNNGSDELLNEIERTSIFPAGGSGLIGGSSEDRLKAESQRPVYDELPNIDDVFVDSSERNDRSSEPSIDAPRDDGYEPSIDALRDSDYEPSSDSDTEANIDNAGVIELSSADVEAASLHRAGHRPRGRGSRWRRIEPVSRPVTGEQPEAELDGEGSGRRRGVGR